MEENISPLSTEEYVKPETNMKKASCSDSASLLLISCLVYPLQALLSACFPVISYFAYSSTPKTEVICSSNSSKNTMCEICMYVPYSKVYRYEALNAILLRTLIHYDSNIWALCIIETCIMPASLQPKTSTLNFKNTKQDYYHSRMTFSIHIYEICISKKFN